MKICPNSPLPSIDTLLVAFKPNLTFPPKFPKLPDLTLFLPGFKWPILPSINMPNFELVMAAVETQMFQLQQTIIGIVKPILSKIGMAIDAFLPKIPGLPDFNLLDIIEGNADKLFKAIKDALAKGIRFPGIPWPLHVTISIPDIEVLQTLKLIMANYMAMVTNLIPDIITKVTKLLKIGNMPAIPKIPTIEEIMDMIKAKIFASLPKLPDMPDIPSLDELMAKVRTKLPDFDMMAILAMLKFPGIPDLTLPNPLFPSFKMPDLEMVTGMLMHAVNGVLGALKPIMDFIEKTLKKFLGFSFPIFCITIPDVTVPVIDLPDVNIPTGIA